MRAHAPRGVVVPVILEPRLIDEPDCQATITASGVPICVYQISDPTPEQRNRLLEVSGSLDFWDRPEEDVYTLGDGDPL